MDLLNELTTKIKELDIAVKSLRTTGASLAKAERDYKVKLREECLKLRDEGMAIGMIDKVCYGTPSIAILRYERDCAEVVYKANQESINSIKLQIRILESQIDREWGLSRKETN